MSNINNSSEEQIKVQTLTLDDGRKAERHTSSNEEGNEIVEIFAEEKRPLKLEKRIIREMKTIVAKETHETIRDGEVTFQEVHSLEQDVPLHIRSRIGLADHHKIVDGDYVRKDEIDKLVSDGVIAGVTMLMDEMQPKKAAPLRIQEVLEGNVEEKKKNDTMVNIIMAVILVAQAAFFGYIFLM